MGDFGYPGWGTFVGALPWSYDARRQDPRSGLRHGRGCRGAARAGPDARTPRARIRVLRSGMSRTVCKGSETLHRQGGALARRLAQVPGRALVHLPHLRREDAVRILRADRVAAASARRRHAVEVRAEGCDADRPAFA